MSVRGGVSGSDTSPAYMLRTDAPRAWAILMPRPSSPSVPTLKDPRTSGGQCWRSMSSLKMKPPAVSTTPRVARNVTVSPKRWACTPDDPPVVDDESIDAGVGRDDGTRIGGGRRQDLHEEPARGPLRLGQMAPGGGTGDGVERVGILAPRVHQPFGPVRGHGGVGAERRVERDTPGHQPVEVAQALVAVAGDLGLVGIRPTGRHHVAEHVVAAVLEAAGRLHGRPASQVDDAFGQSGRTPGATGALGDQDRAPASAALKAAVDPAAPKPTTTTSASSSQ